jgi:DNA-binding NarL/FixJ family response regulator
VLELADSAEALRMAAGRAHVDLLLTDLVMPRVNGRALAEAWREQHPAVKVLFMSGYCEDPAVVDLSLSGHTVLLKPFSGSKLARAIREVLDGAPA